MKLFCYLEPCFLGQFLFALELQDHRVLYCTHITFHVFLALLMVGLECTSLWYINVKESKASNPKHKIMKQYYTVQVFCYFLAPNNYKTTKDTEFNCLQSTLPHFWLPWSAIFVMLFSIFWLETADTRAGSKVWNFWPWYSCQERGCVLTFRSQQETDTHMDTGKHKNELASETL